MLLELNKLKGIDFSKKYFNPTKEYHIKKENYEFTVKPRIHDGLIVYPVYELKFNNQVTYSNGFFPNSFLKYQLSLIELNDNKISAIKELFSDSKFRVEKLFDELTINLEFNVIRSIFLKNGIKTKNKKLLDQHFFGRFDVNDEKDISVIRKKLSRYINVENTDVKNLIHDLYCYWYNPKCKDYYRYYAFKVILGEFNLNLDKIDDLFLIIQSKMLINHDYLTYVKNDDFNENASVSFKSIYIEYLCLINSYHNNYMDSGHYFDDESVSNDIYFMKSNKFFEVEFIKNCALSKNHIVEGKGVGILKFKAKVDDIKEVLGKYGLKKSGNRLDLINRILSNLSTEEINEEFKGSRFILTDDGKKLLDKYDYYFSDYLRHIPHNFNLEEIITLYELNPEYSIPDILFLLSMNDWIIIDNPLLFDNNSLSSLKNDINMQRYYLADVLKKEFPKMAIDLYLKGIHSKLTLYPAIKLCDLYHKQKDFDAELKFLIYLIKEMDMEIDLDSIKWQENKIKQEISLIIKLINNINSDKVDDELLNLDELEKIILEFKNVNGMESRDYIELREKYLNFRKLMIKS